MIGSFAVRGERLKKCKLTTAILPCRQCFHAVGWAAGRASSLQKNWWGAGVVICLERGADLHMAQLTPLPLTVSSIKSTLVLPFWYRLTWVVSEKGPLNV